MKRRGFADPARKSLFLAFFLSVASPFSSWAGDRSIAEPVTYKNLTIFFIEGHVPAEAGLPAIQTLEEALTAKTAIVYETSDVNELEVENLSADTALYIQAGDIVKGGQQDRVLSVDLLLPPKSGKVAISAFCVESGRWAARGDENVGQFESAGKAVIGNDTKLAMRLEKKQDEVWSSVKSNQDKMNMALAEKSRKGEIADMVPVENSASPSSLQLTLENETFQKLSADYIDHFKGLSSGGNRHGFLYAINNEMIGGDFYSDPRLFAKLWPKLLEAAAIEAVAESEESPTKTAPPSLQEAATFFAADLAQGARKKQDAIRDQLTQVTIESGDIVIFDTVDRDQENGLVHRNYLKR